MFDRVAAALFIATWLVVLAVEFSEEIGFIAYDDPALDHSIETILAGLGKAIKVSDDSQVTTSPTLSSQFEAPHPSVVQCVSSHLPREKGKPLLKIYKLHRVFLL